MITSTDNVLAFPTNAGVLINPRRQMDYIRIYKASKFLSAIQMRSIFNPFHFLSLKNSCKGRTEKELPIMIYFKHCNSSFSRSLLTYKSPKRGENKEFYFHHYFLYLIYAIFNWTLYSIHNALGANALIYFTGSMGAGNNNINKMMPCVQQVL